MRTWHWNIGWLVLVAASRVAAMDTGSGIGQAASEMMRELQKAQQDLRRIDKHSIGSRAAGAVDDRYHGAMPWYAERIAKARSREDFIAGQGGQTYRVVSDQDIEVALSSAGGRLYFAMPVTADLEGAWADFYCAGVVVSDPPNNDRSLIFTAAHCIYDDLHGAFARNVLFIPNRAGAQCEDDPIGCWVPAMGVVDAQWVTGQRPGNARWDIGYYVVRSRGSHPTPLENTVGSHPVDGPTALYDLAVCTALPDPTLPEGEEGVIVTSASTCQ